MLLSNVRRLYWVITFIPSYLPQRLVVPYAMVGLSKAKFRGYGMLGYGATRTPWNLSMTPSFHIFALRVSLSKFYKAEDPKVISDTVKHWRVMVPML
jgi:hypothetical protein